MENKNWAEELLSKYSIEDKIFASAMITQNYDLFKRNPSELSQTEVALIDNSVRKHLYAQGDFGVAMTIRVGKAMKASLENPTQPQTGVVQYFKNIVKRIMS